MLSKSVIVNVARCAGVLATVATFRATFKIFAGRFAEYLVHWRKSPVVCALETSLFCASSSSLWVSAIFQYNPVLNLLPLFLRGSTANVSVRLLLLVASYASLSRNMSPRHDANLRDMRNKVVVVTGGASGIGLEVCRSLARQGADIAAVVRDANSGQRLHLELLSCNPTVKVRIIQANLENLVSVSQIDFSHGFFAGGIDGLILNAGGLPPLPARYTAEGMETSLTSMHLAHFLITKMCWTRLNHSARVVVTSSIAQYMCTDPAGIMAHLRDVSSETNARMDERYCNAKFVNAAFARELARRASYEGRNICVTSHHPGVVASNFWNKLPSSRFVVALVDILCALFCRNCEQGAACLIDAISSVREYPTDDINGGGYYVSSVATPPGSYGVHPLLHDEAINSALWVESDLVVDAFAPSGSFWTLHPDATVSHTRTVHWQVPTP
jgi:NAD(P)-dependent dehydrogenase (short-subunit alcohol dehydrogenase family)